MEVNNEKKNIISRDFLLEDAPLTNQKYVLLSFLTNDFLDPKEEDDEQTIIDKSEKKNKLTTKGIKVRGCFESYDEAIKKAESLKVIDPYHNIYIGEIGKWLPFDDNPDMAKDTNYSNDQLNKLMKEYVKEQERGKELYESRKNQMIREALLNNEKKKNTEININEEIDSIVTNLNKSDIEEKIDTFKNELKENQENLDNIKSNIVNEQEILKEKESHLNKINEELENAKRIFTQLQNDMTNK